MVNILPAFQLVVGQHLARFLPTLNKQLFWMVCVGLVEPAVHEGGKVVELLLLEHGGGQHGLVGDPLLWPHLVGKKQDQTSNHSKV